MSQLGKNSQLSSNQKNMKFLKVTNKYGSHDYINLDLIVKIDAVPAHDDCPRTLIFRSADGRNFEIHGENFSDEELSRIEKILESNCIL